MSNRLVFIGDFSGLSLFLSRGVAALGVETVLYSNGDGWKGIPRSNQLFHNAKNPILRAWSQFSGAKLLSESISLHDTLILSTEYIFNRWIDARLLRQLMSKAGRTVLLHAGCSDGFHRLNSGELLCLNCKKYDLHSEQCAFDDARWPGLSNVIAEVDLIVPFTEFYVNSARTYGVPATRIASPLHFPVDFDYVSGLVSEERSRTGAIHGQNRPGFKGTAHLREMMLVCKPLEQLIELLPRMPFVDFINRLSSADVILDQLFASGYGMTGALALATGTSVVYGHASEAPTRGFDGLGCLPVRIVGDIFKDAVALEKVLANYLQSPPNRVEVVRAARARHDHVRIAEEFLKMVS